MGNSMTLIGLGKPRILEPHGFRAEIGASLGRATDLLHFPPETLAVMTPFRRQVITYVYRTALELAHGSLDSAEISVSGMPDEMDAMAIDLILTVNSDWEFVQKLRFDVLDKVAAWSKEWSAEQRCDYGQWVFVCVQPRCP